MFRFGLVVIGLMCVGNSAESQDGPKAYPISVKADDVHEISNLSIEKNSLKLTGKDLLVIPMR